jgi:hypothetical protein
MPGRSQQALYAEIDLELSWSEEALPQVERTKHVHAIHPYLGKFIPQLVEVFLRRHFAPGSCVYDPFAGSGTTLVEANAYGVHSIGCDISAFNCLLARVKTRAYAPAALELALRGATGQARQAADSVDTREASPWLRKWYAPRALRELLAYRCIASETLEDDARDVARVILSRSARSARQTTHFELDFPPRPTTEPYWCLKHKRECVPVQEAAKFLRRYTADTLRRMREYGAIRTPASVHVLHADARRVELPHEIDGIVTSPPYPGLIDYHEQHRYAYELLDLPDLRGLEIGAAETGIARNALESYVDGMASTFVNSRRFMRRHAPGVIVVNDSRNLYPRILAEAGLALEERLKRHVNRRTGRRAGEFFEDVLVCRVA